MRHLGNAYHEIIPNLKERTMTSLDICSVYSTFFHSLKKVSLIGTFLIAAAGVSIAGDKKIELGGT